jgi:hypothetical protein
VPSAAQLEEQLGALGEREELLLHPPEADDGAAKIATVASTTRPRRLTQTWMVRRSAR